MPLSRRQFLLASAALPAGLTAAPARAASHQVTIEGFAFSPAALTIAAGDTVVFANADSAPHTATDANGAFDTGRLNRGESVALTFSAPGTYSYFCMFHRRMTGTITVA